MEGLRPGDQADNAGRHAIMSAAAVIIIRIKRVFSFLRAQGAVSPESAVPEADVPYSNRWYYGRVVKCGAVKRVGDKCYLDEAVAQAYIRARRMRALVFVVVVGLMLCVFWLVWELVR